MWAGLAAGIAWSCRLGRAVPGKNSLIRRTWFPRTWFPRTFVRTAVIPRNAVPRIVDLEVLNLRLSALKIVAAVSFPGSVRLLPVGCCPACCFCHVHLVSNCFLFLYIDVAQT